MKPAAKLSNISPAKKSKRDLFTLSTESLELITGGQGIIANGPSK